MHRERFTLASMRGVRLCLVLAGLLAIFAGSASLRLAGQAPAEGAVEWERIYGNGESERGTAITEDEKGGYFLVGTSIEEFAARHPSIYEAYNASIAGADASLWPSALAE